MKKFSMSDEIFSLIEKECSFAAGFTVAAAIYARSKKEQSEFFKVLGFFAACFCITQAVIIPIKFFISKLHERKIEKRRKLYEDMHTTTMIDQDVDTSIL